MSEIWLATGEATVLAADGQYTDAMPEVMIGNVKGPVGHAFASMAGQVAGHPRMFVIRDLNQQVRPATMMTTKMTVKSEGYVELLGGVVQAATGDAIIDCVVEGILPKAGLSELCMVIMVWLDPRCATRRKSRPQGSLSHQLRSDQAGDLARHQGRADDRRADQKPQVGLALRAGRRVRGLSAFARGWRLYFASATPITNPSENQVTRNRARRSVADWPSFWNATSWQMSPKDWPAMASNSARCSSGSSWR